MGKFIKTLLEQVGGGAAGAAMGMALEGHEDRRQRRQQQALTDIQAEANKKAAAYSQELQMKTWKDTNYSAQMEQLRKAGLNPGLIYGMGGAGGTTGNVMEAGVSGGSAAGQSGEAMGMMRGNMALQAAQIENIKADTEKKKAEVPNVQADTNVKTQSIENLKQNVKSEKAKQALTEIDTKIRDIQWMYTDAKESYENQIQQYTRDLKLLETEILQNERDISDQTKTEVIQTVQQNAANAILQGAAIRAGIEKTQAETISIPKNTLINWNNMETQQKKQAIEQLFIEKNIDLQTADRVIRGIDAVGNMMKISKMK